MENHSQPEESPASALQAECHLLCRYLIGRPAAPQIAQKYVEAHERDERLFCATAFDVVLLRIARISPAMAQWADSYACIAARRSFLRKKLIVLMAILESSSPEHGFDEQIQDTQAAEVVLRIAGRGTLFAFRFATGLLLLGPIHFACALGGSLGERK